MFLFDRTRNSRQIYCTGNDIISVNWRTFLNTNPVFGAESTAAIDDNDNIYFGSHSGNFYSLNRYGNIRWVFTTKKKIYSSPVIIGDAVLFAGW
jgi:outer membrane protein assembly factor BamB